MQPKSLKKHKPQGKLIVIDGADGSGKYTQIQMLADSLRKNGYKFEVVDFPQYGQKSAGLVEEYLNGKYGQVDPYKSSIFFAVDRFDASFKIRKWLGQGKIVISNRYVTASAGHQGGKIRRRIERIRFFKWLNNLEYQVFGIPKPDLNLILHVPAEIAWKLVAKKSKDQRAYAGNKTRDLHEKDLEHQRSAEKVFLEIARIFPNTRLVECVEDGLLLDPERIHREIWKIISAKLSK